VPRARRPAGSRGGPGAKRRHLSRTLIAPAPEGAAPDPRSRSGSVRRSASARRRGHHPPRATLRRWLRGRARRPRPPGNAADGRLAKCPARAPPPPVPQRARAPGLSGPRIRPGPPHPRSPPCPRALPARARRTWVRCHIPRSSHRRPRCSRWRTRTPRAGPLLGSSGERRSRPAPARRMR
jgi:hypothetical protein